MARSLAREAEDFARLMLQTIERLSQDGSWIRATDAFEQTLGDQADHAYIIQLRAKPTRRIGLSGIVERLRTAEFPHIERRKAGNRRNAPVFYRIGRPGPGLDLHLPYEVAASHPLLVQRRTEAAPGEPGSARRAALTASAPEVALAPPPAAASGCSRRNNRALARPAAFAVDAAAWRRHHHHRRDDGAVVAPCDRGGVARSRPAHGRSPERRSPAAPGGAPQPHPRCIPEASARSCKLGAPCPHQVPQTAAAQTVLSPKKERRTNAQRIGLILRSVSCAQTIGGNQNADCAGRAVDRKRATPPVWRD